MSSTNKKGAGLILSLLTAVAGGFEKIQRTAVQQSFIIRSKPLISPGGNIVIEFIHNTIQYIINGKKPE